MPSPGFTLPPDAEASVPPERRGLARDGVRLLVAHGGGTIEHHRFHELPELLQRGDLLVLNTSATLPAALDVQHRGRGALLHVSSRLSDQVWVVELRRAANDGPDLSARRGDELQLPGGVRLRLRAPHPDAGALRSRLWTAEVTPPVAQVPYLSLHGRPIAYRHLAETPPLEALQNVYAGEPGSAEMASAGRPFTAELLVRLMARGVTVTPVVLHAGVSSPELHEPPAPEWFSVCAATARLVNLTRRNGGRVVAVGTTAVRALESAAAGRGMVRAMEGWTELVLDPRRPARVVDGLITGLHSPEASHLRLLEAVAGTELVVAAYGEAVQRHYLWHEFGDSMLFLP